MNSEQFLNSLIDYEKIPGYDYDLNRYVSFLEKLGSPQRSIKNPIHIGGTKGKGSTAAIISSCLQASGYRVGLFTSPHLCRLNERIRINSKPIADQEISAILKKIKPYIKKRHRFRTYFEVLTALACMHFIGQKADFSIMEVGLGGRLDATNTISPQLTVMTRIGYDHTDLLGTRLAQIAAEKAGIIKDHGVLITSSQRPTVMNIIRKTCRIRSCDLIQAQDQHDIRTLKQTIHGSYLKITGPIGDLHTFLPLPGVHQIENLLLALVVLDKLRTKGFHIPSQAVTKGIEQVRLRGRFDIIKRKPLIIFDCAHNSDSFKALLSIIKDLKIEDFSLIFGCSQAKPIDYALRNIFPRARRVLLVKAEHRRAMNQTELFYRAKKYQSRLIISGSIKKAIDYCAALDRRKAIIITGSFYLWQKEWCGIQ